MTDFDKALHDPASVFATPAAVVEAGDLTRDQKIRILRQWELDARELAVAEEENMGGGEELALDSVLAALHRLGATTGEDVAAPTKHGTAGGSTVRPPDEE